MNKQHACARSVADGGREIRCSTDLQLDACAKQDSHSSWHSWNLKICIQAVKERELKINPAGK